MWARLDSPNPTKNTESEMRAQLPRLISWLPSVQEPSCRLRTPVVTRLICERPDCKRRAATTNAHSNTHCSFAFRPGLRAGVRAIGAVVRYRACGLSRQRSRQVAALVREAWLSKGVRVQR